ncbi:hypothetical protein [Aestuariirhabdus litorea]|uniref:Uncharacterized protein n=1 Tax=Aestuariirhabdus litorea TaxID=2528527 RepID=A0A3P3VS45_9GAMM|nr:hypothetical protein [Aestuariirhabdus litorea]RRJ85137.1 hypothetical protein D0544_08740 [Aestuariirhabdus litorea]RWW98360.1 hypothetical protein DZC74_08730 [Endozoicomonadaceae bacterium GTF-13]
MLQPDIEIYIKNTSINAIRDWLSATFEAVEEGQHRGHSYRFQVFHEGQGIPVMVVEKAAGKSFTSVWFDSSATPWNDDLSCARDAHRQLERPVRCNGGFWEDGSEAMDTWVEVSEQGEQLIEWAQTES